jgi:hypothetical protein
MTTFSHACPSGTPYDPYSIREESRELLLYDTPRPSQVPVGYSTLGRRGQNNKKLYANVQANNRSSRPPPPLDFTKNFRDKPNVRFADSNQVYGDIYSRIPSYAEEYSDDNSPRLPLPPPDLMMPVFDNSPPRDSNQEESPPFPSLKRVPWTSSCDDFMSQS